MNETPIKSPCISVCVLNEDDVCEGCWRSLEEIARWQSFDNAQRSDVIEKCKQRRQQSGWFL
jgi:predicted Fe-S protein YdhL (DUF1289 family)